MNDVNAQVDAALDSVLRAAGTSLRNYMPDTRAALRKAMAGVMIQCGPPPTDAETLNRACDAYQKSAEEHGWDADYVADVLRCDDMRAAIAAVWPVQPNA